MNRQKRFSFGVLLLLSVAGFAAGSLIGVLISFVPEVVRDLSPWFVIIASGVIGAVVSIVLGYFSNKPRDVPSIEGDLPKEFHIIEKKDKNE